VLARERGASDLATAIGERVHVVADVVGGRGFGDLLAALRPLGRYVVAGAIAGPQVEADLRTIYLGQLTLLGSSFGTHEDFAAIGGLIAEESLKPSSRTPTRCASWRPRRPTSSPSASSGSWQLGCATE
jgi:NADPH:quinone reductase-like Zn-dependent oxidoreductase